MKRIAVLAISAALLLSGCAEKLTLEQAQARCTLQGGFLVIIHSQKISKGGAVGPDEPSPGDCISPSKFDVPPPAPAAAPAN